MKNNEPTSHIQYNVALIQKDAELVLGDSTTIPRVREYMTFIAELRAGLSTQEAKRVIHNHLKENNVPFLRMTAFPRKRKPAPGNEVFKIEC